MMMNVNVTSNKFNEIKDNFQYENKKNDTQIMRHLIERKIFNDRFSTFFYLSLWNRKLFFFSSNWLKLFWDIHNSNVACFLKLFDYDYEIITFIFRVSGSELQPGHIFLLRFKKNPEVILIYIFTSGLIIYFLVCCRFYFSAVVHVFLVCCSFTFGLFFIHFSNFMFIHFLYIH